MKIPVSENSAHRLRTKIGPGLHRMSSLDRWNLENRPKKGGCSRNWGYFWGFPTIRTKASCDIYIYSSSSSSMGYAGPSSPAGANPKPAHVKCLSHPRRLGDSAILNGTGHRAPTTIIAHTTNSPSIPNGPFSLLNWVVRLPCSLSEPR